MHEQLTRVHPVCWHPYWSSGSNAYLNCACPWLCISQADLSHQGESLAASAVGRNGLFGCRGATASAVNPLYTAVDRFEEMSGQLGEWHNAKASSCIRLSGFSELLVKLEISLTLSGEIDNSNVKRVEEV